jgi:hypothetical protein
VRQEDEPENDERKLGGLEVGSGPELIGSVPERLFKLGVGIFGRRGFGPVHRLGKVISSP